MSVPSILRTRWAAVGAAIAVVLGAGGVSLVDAAIGSGERAVYVPIEPCRLFDTRPDSNVGPRTTPLGPSDTYAVAGIGPVGNCNVPAEAVGLALNVTAVDASEPTFLTIWESGVPRPTASHLNPGPGVAAAPNAVATNLGSDGQFSVFNRYGSVHVLADVVGYYADHHHDDRYYPMDQTYSKADADAMFQPVGDYAPAGDYATADDVGTYVVEMNAGEPTQVIGQWGPLSISMSCTELAGNIEWVVSATSTIGPWYDYDAAHAAGDVIELTSSSTPIDDPTYDFYYPVLSVPSAGVYIIDDGYRNTILAELPDADCRAVGSWLPIIAD